MPRGIDRYDEARLQGRLWTPRSAVDGNVVHWSETLDAVVSIDGSGNLAQLNDKSGFGNHIVQSSAGNRPAWSYTALRGKPAINFVGGAVLLADVPFSNTNNTLSLYAVAALSSSATAHARLLSCGDAGNLDYPSLSYCNVSRDNLTETVGVYRNNTGSFVSVQYNVPFVFSGTFDGTTATPYVNGSAGTGFASSTAFSISSARVGGHIADGSTNWYGPVSAIVVDRAAPTTRRRQLIEGYLAWRFGVALVGQHPFANRPPLIGD